MDECSLEVDTTPMVEEGVLSKLVDEIDLSTTWDDIIYALDDWLRKISVMEERERRVSTLEEKIDRTLQQIQQDGLISICGFESLLYWSDLG